MNIFGVQTAEQTFELAFKLFKMLVNFLEFFTQITTYHR